jgi:hypothetical protein
MCYDLLLCCRPVVNKFVFVLTYSVYLRYVRAREQIHHAIYIAPTHCPLLYTTLAICFVDCYRYVEVYLFRPLEQIHKGICRVSWELGYRGVLDDIGFWIAIGVFVRLMNVFVDDS